jgi:hypothetical protein
MHEKQSLQRWLIHSKEWAKTYLQRVSWLYQLVMRWKSRRVPSLLVRRDSTKIAIEAYPRSSNSFAVRLFKHANPQVKPNEIAHHTHNISNIKQAVKWGIPALVIVREPVDAISSNMLALKDTSNGMLEILAVKYVDFHQWVRDNMQDVVVARFEDITQGHFRKISEALNQHFGTNFSTKFDEALLAQQARESIKRFSPHKSNPNRVPIPSKAREDAYSDLRPRIRASRTVQEATRLYHEIIDMAISSD